MARTRGTRATRGSRHAGRWLALALALPALAVLPACQTQTVTQPVSAPATCVDTLENTVTATRPVTLQLVANGPASAAQGSTATFSLTVQGADPKGFSGTSLYAAANAVTTGLGKVTPWSNNQGLHPTSPQGGFSNNVPPPPETGAISLRTATAVVTGAVGSTATLAVSAVNFESWSMYPIRTSCTLTSPAPVVWKVSVTAPSTTG